MELGIRLVSWLDLEKPSACHLVLGNLSTCICLGIRFMCKPSSSSGIYDQLQTKEFKMGRIPDTRVGNRLWTASMARITGSGLGPCCYS